MGDRPILYENSILENKVLSVRISGGLNFIMCEQGLKTVRSSTKINKNVFFAHSGYNGENKRVY